MLGQEPSHPATQMEDFELKIDFVRHTAEPARVFRSMAGLIDATTSYNVAPSFQIYRVTQHDYFLFRSPQLFHCIYSIN